MKYVDKVVKYITYNTFKSAANIGFVRKRDGKWIKLFKCIFCVMGIDGRVC